jgi:hypothetical protein
MPYMNNLDLAVFPSMSLRHNVLLRQLATNVVQPDKIWEAVGKVWRDLESCTALPAVCPCIPGCRSSNKEQRKQ